MLIRVMVKCSSRKLDGIWQNEEKVMGGHFPSWESILIYLCAAVFIRGFRNFCDC